jgi:hypothetical protein
MTRKDGGLMMTHGKGRMEYANPETSNYEDTGCDIAPACLACPMDVCRYDDVTALRRYRHSEIRRRYSAGESKHVLAAEFRISVHTVERASSRGAKR